METLARSGPLRSDDLTIMTNSEGIGSRAVDSLNQGGGSLTRLTDETLKRLDALLPAVRPHGNPANIRADATGERYANVLRILTEAQEVDTILILHTPTAMASGMAVAEAVVRVVSETGGNVLTCWIGGETALPVRNLFARASIPSYGLPGIAVRAFLHRVHHRRNQELLIQTPPSVPQTFVPTTDMAQAAVRKTLAEGKTVMADPETKVVLAAYGLPTVPTRTPGRRPRPHS